ncbi:hypothetical protein [uncultured Sphingomonas sp.]|uniref:hypothetical protein n=1 Tax=uncultured Sphingomonas sp. TaxID=158754 RepID=UPI0025CE5F2D|nr:hypothetical protein [uncultured Sphingomonas sp.]
MTHEHDANGLSVGKRNDIFRSLRELKQEHQTTMNKDVLAELLIGAAITRASTAARGSLAPLPNWK